MHKKTILIILLLLFVFSSISYAAENPFKGLTETQIISKYFEKRDLDPLEGIWLDERFKKQIVVKISMIETENKFKGYDYMMILLSSEDNTTIDTIKKTEYPLCFYRKNTQLLRLLSPTTFHYENYKTRSSLFTRIYPSPF